MYPISFLYGDAKFMSKFDHEIYGHPIQLIECFRQYYPIYYNADDDIYVMIYHDCLVMGTERLTNSQNLFKEYLNDQPLGRL